MTKRARAFGGRGATPFAVCARARKMFSFWTPKRRWMTSGSASAARWWSRGAKEDRARWDRTMAADTANTPQG